MQLETPAGQATTNETRIADQLEQIVLKRIADNSLALPTLPTVVARCLERLRNPDVALRDLVPILEADPVVTVQLIRHANSAALGAREPAQTIPQVLARLGIAKLRSSLLEMMTQKLFQSTDERIDSACRKLWIHSQAVALLSRDVATLTTDADPEIAYLSGLLHDVGKPILATMLLEAERMVRGSAKRTAWIGSTTWVEVIQRSHRRVGVALAEHWKLPAAIHKAIYDCADFDTNDRGAPANAVLFANALIKKAGLYLGPFDEKDNEAVLLIGRSLIGIDEGVAERLVAGVLGQLKDDRASPAGRGGR